MKVRIFGNSHVAALNRGLKTIETRSRNISIFPIGSGAYETSPFSRFSQGRVFFSNKLYADNLKKFTRNWYLSPDIAWGVCMGTHTSRICRDDFWREAEPATICATGKRPVPETTVEAIIESDQRYVKAMLTQMKQAGLAVFVLSCPPLRTSVRNVGTGVRLEVAAYLDAMARRNFVEFLEKEDIPFISPPPETITEDGFLEERFHQELSAKGTPDAHHANAEYGALMMQRVLDWLDTADLPMQADVA